MLALQFLYGLRVAGALAVGMSDVPWFRFLIVNFIGAFGWALIVTGGGYGFGQALAWLKAEFNADVAWIIVPVLLTAMLAWMSLRRRASRVSGK
jgi:membrane protein DedA with SNARE-associated domain